MMHDLIVRLLGREQTKLAELTPYLMCLDERQETFLTNVGGLGQVAVLEPRDLETASPWELSDNYARVADLWDQFTSGVSFTMDMWRYETPKYLPPNDFGENWAAQQIDESRRRKFESGGTVHSNTTFAAVTQIGSEREALLRWFRGDPEPPITGIVKAFEENAQALFRSLKMSMRDLQVLSGDALAGYMAATTSFRVQDWVQMPDGLLAPQLATSLWNSATKPMMVDDRYVETVELMHWGNPTPLTAAPLFKMPFEYRWTTTLHALDPEDRTREIRAAIRSWRAKQKGLSAYITEWWTKNPWASKTNPEADVALDDLQRLMAQKKDQPFGLAHCNFHVWDENASAAKDKAQQIVAVLRDNGLRGRRADVSAIRAKLGDMPGNVSWRTRNERRPRINLNKVARLSPLSGISSGSLVDSRFGGDALLMGSTALGTTFAWAMNAPGSHDAHTRVVGKTGSGKSSLLAFMAAQFLRYPKARVIFIDRRGSFYVPCLALGGEWINLGSGGPAVQPLRMIHIESEFIWSHAWILRAIQTQGVSITTAISTGVSEAMRDLVDLDPDERTLSRLLACMSGAGEEARQALAVWCRRGPYGETFDGVVRGYGAAPVLGVETALADELGEAEGLMLQAFVRSLERDILPLPGPKLLILDECHHFFDHPFMAARVEKWVRELRKFFTALVVATQEPRDFAGKTGTVVASQCGNSIWCPHPQALRPEVRTGYEAVGLSEEKIAAIGRAVPMSDYLFETQLASRWLTLRLDGTALDICGAGVGIAHERADELLAHGIRPGEDFARAWLSEPTSVWYARREAELREAA